MKRLILACTMIVLCCTSVVSAEEQKSVFKFKDNRQITVTDKGEFIEVVTANNSLRIYPCGEVNKLKWEQINPNEDVTTNSTVSAIPWGRVTTVQY